MVVQFALRVVLPGFYSHCKETLLFFFYNHPPAESDIKELWKLFRLLSTKYNTHLVQTIVYHVQHTSCTDYCPPCTTHILYLQRISL